MALSQGNIALIGEGLQAGEHVVTDGQEKLQAGMKVEPTAPAPTMTTLRGLYMVFIYLILS